MALTSPGLTFTAHSATLNQNQKLAERTSPDTIAPRMMAEPCPAKPNDTAFTPWYSTGVSAC